MMAVWLVIGLLMASVQPAGAEEQAEAVSELGGRITLANGAPAENVKVDLFETDDSGRRGTFLGTTRTGVVGRFRFAVAAGCYTVTVIAPDGELFAGRRWFQPSTCVAAGEVVDDLDAGFDGARDAVVGGTVNLPAGEAGVEVKVDLFVRAPGGGRSSFLGFTRTDDQGNFSFPVNGGCYVLTLTAPSDFAFEGRTRFFQEGICVAAGAQNLELEATLVRDDLSLVALEGQVTSSVGDPVEGVKVTIFESSASGGRGAFIGRVFTGADGRFSARAALGCHLLIFVAPDGDGFDGSPYFERATCGGGSGLNARLDRPRPTISASLNTSNVVEGAAGETTTADVTVRLNPHPTVPVTVDLSTADGNATVADGDYQALTTVLSFQPGENSKTVSIVVNGDDRPEDTEAFVVHLSNASPGVIIRHASGLVDIETDDRLAPRYVDLPDGKLWLEADGQDRSVPVTLDSPATERLTVDVQTVDATATAGGGDYAALSETLVFESGEQTKYITLRGLADDEVEADESFLVMLRNPSPGLTLGRDLMAATIPDRGRDEQLPSIGIGNSPREVDEGGSLYETLWISGQRVIGAQYLVRVRTVDGTASAADGDYVAFDEVVDLSNGAQSLSIEIPEDQAAESDETFLVVVSDPSTGLLLSDDVMAITILDDDGERTEPVPTISTGFDYEGTTVSVSLVLSRDQHDVPLSVEVATLDGSASAAEGDYVPVSTTLTINPGQSRTRFDLQLLDDDIAEQSEVVYLVLSNPSPGLSLHRTVFWVVINDRP